MTAAARKILMGDAPWICRQYTIADGGAKARGELETVRFAGLRRLHPIVPDRTAFGAAIEGKPDGGQAEKQYKSPEHRSTPRSAIIGPQAASRECPFPPNAV